MSVAETALSKIDRNWLRRFRRNLQNWYARHGRDLSWRVSCDPYRVWISEIMLQQTTVAAVVPYFQRFLERFPTLPDLAAADEQDVLRCWEGLGYYSRARNIHKTARLIVDDYHGRFPESVEHLMRLPGIGRYTAGAIASFAFNRPAPIVEANTLRLYCRLLGFDGDPRSKVGQQLLWDFARRVIPRSTPGLFNQALMDLGAMICTSTGPDCQRCPVRSCCRAFRDGLQQAIPIRAARPRTTHLTEAAVAIRRNGRYLLQRRVKGERWAGLWDFVRIPLTGKLKLNGSAQSGPSRTRRGRGDGGQIIPAQVRRKLTTNIARETGLNVQLGPLLAEMDHSVTRYRIHLLCIPAECTSRSAKVEYPLRWVHPRDLSDYPLSVTGRKLVEILTRIPHHRDKEMGR